MLDSKDTAWPVLVYTDSQSALAAVREHKYHRRTRHIHIKYNHARKSVKDKLMTLEYIRTDKMLADPMTKALHRKELQAHARSMGLSDPV